MTLRIEDVVVGITTVPRRTDDDVPCNYLADTLRNLDQVQWPSSAPWYISYDAGGKPTPEDTALAPRARVVEHNRRLGVYGNWRYLAELLVAQYGPDRPYLMLQDDVQLSNGVVPYLPRAVEQSLATKPVGCFSLYTSPAMVPDGCAGANAFVPAALNKHSFWGALALLFPAGQLTKLLAAPRFLAHEHTARLDVVIGNTLVFDLGLELCVHVPSLCEHTGDWSTIGRHKIRSIQKNRRGYDFKPNFFAAHLRGPDRVPAPANVVAAAGGTGGTDATAD